jgi:hypothetical protein
VRHGRAPPEPEEVDAIGRLVRGGLGFRVWSENGVTVWALGKQASNRCSKQKTNLGFLKAATLEMKQT